MKLPREVSGRELATRLRHLGYEVTRRSGSHIRLTTIRRGEHHVTIPDHANPRVGTLSGIPGSVAEHFVTSRSDIVARLFRDG